MEIEQNEELDFLLNSALEFYPDAYSYTLEIAATTNYFQEVLHLISIIHNNQSESGLPLDYPMELIGVGATQLTDFEHFQVSGYLFFDELGIPYSLHDFKNIVTYFTIITYLQLLRINTFFLLATEIYI